MILAMRPFKGLKILNCFVQIFNQLAVAFAVFCCFAEKQQLFFTDENSESFLSIFLCTWVGVVPLVIILNLIRLVFWKRMLNRKERKAKLRKIKDNNNYEGNMMDNRNQEML